MTTPDRGFQIVKTGVTRGKRLNHELPAVTAKLGWRYHHIGIPHTVPRAREHHVAHLGVHVAGLETSPYGIEWIRFAPTEPSVGVRVAFILDDGAPIELLQFDTSKAIRPKTRHAAGK